MKTIDNRHHGAALILASAVFVSSGCSALNSSTAPTPSASSPAPNGASSNRYDGPKASLAVAAFAVKAPKAKDVGGDGLADMLATALFESNRFIVIERQALPAVASGQKLDAAGGGGALAAPGAGPIKGADLLVIGAVTEFEPNAAGAKLSVPDHEASTDPPAGKKKKAAPSIRELLEGVSGGVATSHLAIDLRILDARTSRVVAASTVEGKAADLDLSGLGKHASPKLGVGLSLYARSPMEKAIRLALRDAVQFVASKTPSEYYRYRDTNDGVMASTAPTPGGAAAAPAASSAPPTAPVKVLYISATEANVRVGPSKDTAILTTVKRATKVVVVGDHNSWYRVRLENGGEGWVAASVTSSERP
jgi:curli biogenesis system outer membrane secretion channel CsgG